MGRMVPIAGVVLLVCRYADRDSTVDARRDSEVEARRKAMQARLRKRI